MTKEKRDEFIKRIQSISANDKPSFGQMNVHQMICHCTDQLRMLFGEIEGLKRQNFDVEEIQKMARRGETVPTIDKLDQVAGGGTKPTDFENDKQTLIHYLNRFNDCDENYNFSFHPYFGEMDKVRWERLVIYHLNYHIKQFQK